jgi:oligopeptide transport system substrate-binding protein
MRGGPSAGRIAGPVLTLLVASACVSGASDDGAGPGEEPPGSAARTTTLRIVNHEPAFLVPGLTNEPAGGAVLSALYSPLVTYDHVTGDPVPLVASTISASNGNRSWTITINDGWTFHNGEPLTAQSFVDTWNWVAYGPNSTNGGYYFGPGTADVVGYADLQPGADPDGDGPAEPPAPAAHAMSGLRVLDKTTFTVELAEPTSQFPLMLGISAFYPMPAACLADWEACNEAPIGNGPYKIDGSWRRGEGITLVRYDGYVGPTKPSVDKIEFVTYTDDAIAYLDLQDGLVDLMVDVPPEVVPDARATFGDHVIEASRGTYSYMGLPLWDAQFGGTVENGYGGEGKADLRHALSMAIDRQDLIDRVLGGGPEPADALMTANVYGYRPRACGVFCDYDLAAARALYERSDQIDGPINIWHLEGGSYETASAAIGEYWQEAFGIDYQLQPRPWAAYLQAQADQTMDGPFTFGWLVDYPSVENFLGSLFRQPSGEQNYGYTNDAVNQLLVHAKEAPTLASALELYHQAEDLIIDDMPIIPLWSGHLLGAYGERVSDVFVDRFGSLDYTKVRVSD